MTQISLPEVSTKGLDPSPFILWYNPFDDRFLTWIMTLEGGAGAQLGERLHVYLPPGRIPVDVLWSTHLFSEAVLGFDPTPFILFEDYLLHSFPVSYSPDGTPVAEAPTSYVPPVDPDDWGYATCLSEVPGSEFVDGNPRLFVGTEAGFIVVLMYVIGVGFVFDGAIPVSDVPVIDVEPIPQYGYISLGALTGNMIYGIDPETSPRDSKESARESVVYTLTDPRATTLTDIEVFGLTDAPLADPDDIVHLVLADGTSELALTDVTGMQAGSETLTVRLDSTWFPIRSIASGSLLLLKADGSGVLYDPGYSGVGGSSSCQLDITDEVSDSCSYLCGDCNDDARVTVADANYLVGYIYRDGLAPVGEGDVNLDTRITIADANYVVSYIYRGGPPPCEPTAATNPVRQRSMQR
jgi:hypothetical protein